MIGRTGCRFSDKIMLETKGWSRMKHHPALAMRIMPETAD
jgi:hypothetical protein